MNEHVVSLSAPSANHRLIDTGLLALVIVGRAHQVDIDAGVLAHELGLGASMARGEDLVRGARLSGLHARHLTSADAQRLSEVPRPAILRMQDGGYLVLTRMPNGEDGLHDPLDVRPRSTSLEQICETWSGEIVLVTRRSELDEVEKPFGLGWFLESFLRHRKSLINILISSLFIQLFALISPLMFQVVVDKVLIHKSESTLDVIAIALGLMAVFDVSLQYLRSYALFHTASRIDVDLGAQVISRLFKLPLGYFETRPTGQTVARVREIENIRAFLTGQASTSIVDALFTLIFIAFLFSYSVKMTIVVVCSIPVYLLVVFGIRPLLRDKTKERFSRGAYSQQYLVESIVGASTVKAAAIEPLVQQQWEERLAAYVKASFQSVMLGNLGQVLIQFVSKITTALILYFGAEAVMAGDLTVGQLVAFNMLSGQLVQPIIRLSQLWQDIQQVQISVDRIGDIFNAAQEEHASSMAQIPRDAVHGAIRLQNVSFRYTEGTPDVLSQFSLDIPAGQVIGIVGPSGSGKSTLTKLIQRLYVPRQGKVSIDGFDIAHVHSAWFRRQMGVVLQENLLFNRSLHENIAIANPGMPRDRVAGIAKLAGADEFIREMPMGYATQIEERGANLSGGQRQRIAIARALARNPRILIFDEATSALDYESERIIQENMRQMVQGRTVIIVAHRLAAVRDCDRIISMDKGRIVEDGTHDELLRNENGLYANLWSLQRPAT